MILVILCITMTSWAQNEKNQVRLRIDDTMEEIRKDVPAAVLKQGKETGTYLFHDAEHVWVFYYIKNNVCHTQAYAYHVTNTALVLQPFSDPNAYIRINNMKYLRIEDKRILTFDFSIEGNLLTLIVTKE
jgi:hypothetical protein